MVKMRIIGKSVYDFEHKKFFLLKKSAGYYFFGAVAEAPTFKKAKPGFIPLLDKANIEHESVMPENVFQANAVENYWDRLRDIDSLNIQIEALENDRKKLYEENHEVLVKIEATRTRDLSYWVEYNPEQDYNERLKFFMERSMRADAFYQEVMQRVLEVAPYWYDRQKFIDGITELLPVLRPVDGWKRFTARYDEHEGYHYFGTKDDGLTWCLLRTQYRKDWVEDRIFTLAEVMDFIEKDLLVPNHEYTDD